MKALRRILIALGVIIGIYLVLCLIGPKGMDVSRSAEVNASAETVYAQVADLKKWENWSPWYKDDPEMKITYGATTEGTGGVYSWVGTKSSTGKGSLTITDAQPGKSLKTELNFDGSIGNGTWDFEDLGDNKSKVTWGMKSDIPFMVRGLLLIMNPEVQLIKTFDRGLASIAEIAESVPVSKAPEYNILEVEIPEKTFVMAREVVPFGDLQQHFAKHFGNIYGAVTAKNVEFVGKPCGVYFSWDEEKQETDLGAAIGVKDPVKIDGYTTETISASKGLLIEYYGSYEDSKYPHEAMGAHLKKHGITQKGPVIEEYVTDPSTEVDPSKWLTKIYYYVE